MRIHYAHSLEGAPVERWHKLDDHLTRTAARAETFAHTFAPGWGRLAGLWHDAGKYQIAFQNRIGVDPDAHASTAVYHASVGARIAMARKAAPLALAIAGHHGGLGNCRDVYDRLCATATSALLDESRRDGMPPSLESEPLPEPPGWIRSDKRKLALWVRFVYSALVDADFLDTERFYEGAERDLPQVELVTLLQRLESRLSQLQIEAESTPVNEMRARILSACRSAAELDTGAFTLTVPTGGGKTLSSLAFALGHAVEHNLRRVIVVIPFTSILEQTAKVYRQALGEECIIEHHSNLDPDHESARNRLASENWDAPVVVTTSVQFFESLYANRSSRCRKLHRIARSVVVFDEVQTFPPKLLLPIQDVLKQLVADYGVTAVLCTATQPALSIPGSREIVLDVAREFATVANRCEVLMPPSRDALPWEALADALKTHTQVMAIVNRRDDAENLARLVGDGCLHLSARMCAAHRSSVIAEVKRRLVAGERCRLVATQLVEAGVDLDFPDVYRAFAGADSMAQAAGRCNREGKRPTGTLHVFIPPSEPPKGMLLLAKRIAETMWTEASLDLRDHTTFRDYFDRLYRRVETGGEVLAAERELNFEEAARLFRMIDESGESVVAPYCDADARLTDIRRDGISRLALRRLQPYTVNLYPQEVRRLAEAGAIERIEDRLWCVVKGFEHVYDSQRFGFGWKGPIAAEPEELIA